VGAISEELQRTCAICRFQHRIALILKHSAYHASQAVLILDYEHGVSGLRDWAPAVHADSAR
jgi:hypothetical protein